jgi:hypothetical protein
MTFNVMQNADTCFENAYLALQANFFLYLSTQDESKWKDENIELVLETL